MSSVTLPPSTITLPPSIWTVTLSPLTQTLPASTISVTVASNVTLPPSTVTLPPITLPPVTVVAPPSTVTITATSTSRKTVVLPPSTTTQIVTKVPSLQTLGCCPLGTNFVSNPSFERPSLHASTNWNYSEPDGTDDEFVLASSPGAPFDSAMDGRHYFAYKLGPGTQTELVNGELGLNTLTQSLPLCGGTAQHNYRLQFYWRQYTDSGDGECIMLATSEYYMTTITGTPRPSFVGFGLANGDINGAGQDWGWRQQTIAFTADSLMGRSPAIFALTFNFGSAIGGNCLWAIDQVSLIAIS
jgi:hypothetical protein